jgi:hypothetical protein
MKLRTAFQLAFSSLVVSAMASAASFVNGNFETGNATGWTVVDNQYRPPVSNSGLSPTTIESLPDGSGTHSSVVTPGADPNVGSVLNRVYSGNYSWRVEDTTNGGYASMISQTVSNYTDPDIFFAWAAVLEGAHGTNDAATMKIYLTDLTANEVLISREYNAASSGSGVDPRFILHSSGFFYTSWQVEQLTIGAGRQGHNFRLDVLASDCQPAGHAGYVYLDGFGAVTPPPVDPSVPEPGTYGLMAAGLGGIFALRRRISR